MSLSPCRLCGVATAPGQLTRLSGLDLCDPCAQTDPTRALEDLGMAVEWDCRFRRFAASVHLGLPGDFRLNCVPQQAVHKVLKWVVDEVEVGDPTFDDVVYVRTSDAEQAASLLASEGVQSALLALLAQVRINDLVGNHVTLDGPTLTVNVGPYGPLDEAQVAGLKRETAALVLHLVDSQ